MPDQPLTAQGLATPWELTGGAQCQEANPETAAFVQGAVLDPATGQVSTYDPLVVGRGARAAADPVVPTLPAGAVVGIWVGFNGATLQLGGPGAASCTDGVNGSLFNQNAFCNATAFFTAANQAIGAGKLKVPALGTARDGKTCPSTRDFSVVDQDMSDNTTVDYLVTGRGEIAQDTPQNRARLRGATTEANGSDEGLVANALDAALACAPWKVPDLADSTHAQQLPAWPLNELQAAADQAAPVATVPALDPFVLVNGQPNLAKLNAYRSNVDQAAVANLGAADTKTYCQDLLQTGLPRIAQDRQLTAAAPSPMPAVANNLFTFLAQRFAATFSDNAGFLHCTRLLHTRNPVTTTANNAGVVVDAQIRL